MMERLHVPFKSGPQPYFAAHIHRTLTAQISAAT